MPSRAAAPRCWPFRYELIDGLRGLASLVVLMEHTGIAGLGHWAVMVFFVISGYCIAAAAEAGRRVGMGFGEFMWRRLRRIYPPYFFAVVFYVSTRLVKAAGGDYRDLARPWLDWVQTLTLTQWLWLPFHPVSDPPQNPKLVVAAFWSLNYEDQFYVIMAAALLLALKRGVPMPLVVSVLTAMGLIWNWAAPGGWITGIFIEYWAHFSLGALLFWVLCVFPGRAPRALLVAAVSVLAIYSAARIFPWQPDTMLHLRAYAELFVACAFTLFLYLVRPYSAAVSRSWLWRPAAALGTISYSLYLIHQFNLTLVAEVTRRLAPHAFEPVRLSLVVGLHVLIASVFWYVCERPFLNRSPPRGLTAPELRAAAGAGSEAAAASPGSLAPLQTGPVKVPSPASSP